MSAQKQTKVKVYVRSRPTEIATADMIEYGNDKKTINIYNKRRPVSHNYVNNQVTDWSFKVDGLLNNVTQDEVYERVVKDITLKTLKGYNGTVMCYGQTGAGKTFSMTGATENYQQRGIIPRTIQHLFKEIQSRSDYQFTVRIGYLEIYNEQLFDLLSTIPMQGRPLSSDSSSNLSIFEDRGDVFVKGLSYQLAANEEEALNLLFEGETNRSIGAHVLNKESSRSHCIFTIRIETKSVSSSDEKYTLSKLNLVDLAGSERLAKTQSQGITQKEAQYINKSLSFLEQVVIGLTEKKKSFVQFRQSKLTHLLKDSIGGNCLTSMISNIWPELRHMEETISTLRFSSRMMNVTIEPAVNEIIDPMRMMQKLDNEVKMLRQELSMHDTLANRRVQSYEPLSEHQLLDIENQCRRFIDGSLEDIEIVNLRQVQHIFKTFKRICKQIDKDVETRLREKFALIDKNDAEQMAEAQKAGLTIENDNSLLVGETDGQNFGIGLAGKDSRASKSDLSKVSKSKTRTAAAKNSDSKSNNKSSSPSLLLDSKSAKNKHNNKDDNSRDINNNRSSPSLLNQNKDHPRPSTPPVKNLAFEEFKQERGSEINRIWNENKEILATKRRLYSDLAYKINETKAKIDTTRIKVERKRAERAELGEFVNEMGETIIDEEEFALIKLLQDLKGAYRDDFEKWRELKAEIVYCQNLVEQCRHRLIQEFDAWYNETYLNPYNNNNQGKQIDDQPKYGSAVLRQYEDAADKFERMQRDILSDDMDSIPYTAARLRNERKHIYNDALEKASHYYLNDNKQQQQQQQQQQLGAPYRRVANPPPGKLTLSS